MVAFTAIKRDTLFFGSAPYVSFEPGYSEIYVNGVYRGVVSFVAGRLNRPFGLILEESPWLMLEGRLKMGRVDFYTSLKPFHTWEEIVRAGTYAPEAENPENPSLPVFAASGTQTMSSVLSHVKGDLFYFTKVVTTPPLKMCRTDIRVKGVLRAVVDWPEELKGSTFGFRRGGTGSYTKGPEKTFILQEGTAINLDF